MKQFYASKCPLWGPRPAPYVSSGVAVSRERMPAGGTRRDATLAVVCPIRFPLYSRGCSLWLPHFIRSPRCGRGCPRGRMVCVLAGCRSARQSCPTGLSVVLTFSPILPVAHPEPHGGSPTWSRKITRRRLKRTKVYAMSIRSSCLFPSFHQHVCTPEIRYVLYHTTSLPKRILSVHP